MCIAPGSRLTDRDKREGVIVGVFVREREGVGVGELATKGVVVRDEVFDGVDAAVLLGVGVSVVVIDVVEAAVLLGVGVSVVVIDGVTVGDGVGDDVALTHVPAMSASIAGSLRHRQETQSSDVAPLL